MKNLIFSILAVFCFVSSSVFAEELDYLPRTGGGDGRVGDLVYVFSTLEEVEEYFAEHSVPEEGAFAFADDEHAIEWYDMDNINYPGNNNLSKEDYQEIKYRTLEFGAFNVFADYSKHIPYGSVLIEGYNKPVKYYVPVEGVDYGRWVTLNDFNCSADGDVIGACYNERVDISQNEEYVFVDSDSVNIVVIDLVNVAVHTTDKKASLHCTGTDFPLMVAEYMDKNMMYTIDDDQNIVVRKDDIRRLYQFFIDVTLGDHCYE